MAEYVHGRRHGLEITWYENGRKWTETPYRDGVPDGLSVRWDPEGKILGKTYWNRGVMRQSTSVAPRVQDSRRREDFGSLCERRTP